jgi:hypothetical protein
MIIISERARSLSVHVHPFPDFLNWEEDRRGRKLQTFERKKRRNPK